jgi:hypothetical protein
VQLLSKLLPKGRVIVAMHGKIDNAHRKGARHVCCDGRL